MQLRDVGSRGSDKAVQKRISERAQFRLLQKISEDRTDKEHFRRGHENWRAGEDSETFRELRSAYDQVSFLLLAW